MSRLLFSLILLITPLTRLQAQDTLVLHSQPQWEKGMPIDEYCGFYADLDERPLGFEGIRELSFGPYKDSLRTNKPTMRPLVVEWLKFTIRNASLVDTLKLWINPGGHYFLTLYNQSGLLARSGIYESRVAGINRTGFPISLGPDSIQTYWIRTEDRQGKFIPDWISLETPYTLAKSHNESVWNSRVLFLLLSLLTGCLFFVSLFAAYQYLLYQDAAFLWYIGYTLAAAFTGLFWIDVRHQFGIFSPFMMDLIFSIFLFLVPVMYSAFIGKILKIPRYFPKSRATVKILMAIAGMQMLIEFTTIRTGRFLFTDYYGYAVSMIPVTVMNVILLVLTALSREKVKWFLFGGLMSMLLLWCLPLMVIPNMDFRTDAFGYVLIFVPFYFLLGLTVEAICFVFALSYRSKLVLMEKNSLQEQFNQELQQQLQERTKELQEKSNMVEAQKLKQIQVSFEKKMAETEMTALRAQMNPHFIFNCLNSIKLFALENNTKDATEYLTKFSRLIRIVLENSISERITLKQELDTLQLYLDLEIMRFKDKVKYHIQVDEAIDTQYIEIPPLLIQPYVENAIWHGLMHKKEGGLINIDIRQAHEQLVVVEITDNGVGRKRAEALKSKSATHEKSFGMKMTTERIDIINQVYGIGAEVQVDDVEDAFQNVIGTKVIIKIPV